MDETLGISLAVRCVRSLMERHGLPKHRHSAWLAEATGLSYAQAHRRMTGASPWSLESLSSVAALFGETLTAVVEAVEGAGNSTQGVLRVGETDLDCQLWVGEQLEGTQPTSIVAVKRPFGWAAIESRQAEGEPVYAIRRLNAAPSTAPKKSIAVLDDDVDLANSICDYLTLSGYEARPFYTANDFSRRTATHHFDGYVMDWIIDESNVTRLISTLRDQDKRCPIIVLTGQVNSGAVDEADVANAVKQFDLLFSEKPVRSPILVATLSRAFAANRLG